MSIYVPYDEGSAYPWNVGLAASGNHILPYGVSLPSDPCLTFVDQEASLLESNEDLPAGYIEAPEGVEVNYSYAASAIYVDTAKSTVKGKAEGISEITITLSLDGIELARAIRPVEVMHGMMPLAAEVGAWVGTTSSGHTVEGGGSTGSASDSLFITAIYAGTNKDGHLVIDGKDPSITSVFCWDSNRSSWVDEPFIDPTLTTSIDTRGSSIKEIRNTAFKDFVNLKRLQFGVALQSIEGNSFTGCPSISEIIIDSYVSPVESTAFDQTVKDKAIVRIYERYNEPDINSISTYAEEPSTSGDKRKFSVRAQPWSEFKTLLRSVR